MHRPEDWPLRLARFFEERRDRPFDWRANNCCLFAADWVLALTGEDLAAPYRELVTDREAALALLETEGGAEAIAARLCQARGWPSSAVGFARRGDLVAIETGGQFALGVCDGLNSGFAGPAGLELRRTKACRRAWRVM